MCRRTFWSDVEAGHDGSPRRRLEQRAEHADGGRLAGAIGTEESVYLAPADIEIEPVHGGFFAEAGRVRRVRQARRGQRARARRTAWSWSGPQNNAGAGVVTPFAM